MKFGTLSGPLVAMAALTLVAGQASADVISINGLLTNPSFENGAQGSPFIGCPTGWTCSNNFSSPQSDVHVYDPSTAQYASGSPPYGQFAVYVPENAIAGSSTLLQTVSTTWNSNNSYTLTLSVGQPNTTINNSAEDIWRTGSQVRVIFYAADTLQTVFEFDVTSANAPGVGNWKEFQISIPGSTVNSVLGSNTTHRIGLEFPIFHRSRKPAVAGRL